MEESNQISSDATVSHRIQDFGTACGDIVKYAYSKVQVLARITISILGILWYFIRVAQHRINRRIVRTRRHFKENAIARNVEEYAYEHLQQHEAIRLLNIVSGDDSDPIECEVTEVPIEGFENFTALSYTWGPSEDDTETVRPDGAIPYAIFFVSYLAVGILEPIVSDLIKEPIKFVLELLSAPFMGLIWPTRSDTQHWIICNTQRIQIRKNLYECLLQLRSSGTEENLWIDALCINQTDIAERNSQVQLMSRIYSSAQRVIVWLGPCPDLYNSPQMFEWIRRPPDWKDFQKSNAVIILAQLIFFHMFAISHAVSSNYFGRVWVIQEFLLSKNAVIMIGRHELQPEDLIEAIKREKWKGSAANADVLTFLESRQVYQESQNWQYVDYYLAANGHGATDERDMVFAGTGIVEHLASTTERSRRRFEQPGLCILEGNSSPRDLTRRPDYTATSQEALTDGAIRLYKEVGLFTLSFACTEIRPESFPSWVPTMGGSHSTLFEMELEPDFTCGHGLTTRLQISHDQKLLHVKSGAEHVDYISAIYSDFDGEKMLTMLQELATERIIYEESGESMLSALARTLIANHIEKSSVADISVVEGLAGHIMGKLNEKIGEAGSNKLELMVGRMTWGFDREKYLAEKEEEIARAEVPKRALELFLVERGIELTAEDIQPADTKDTVIEEVQSTESDQSETVERTKETPTPDADEFFKQAWSKGFQRSEPPDPRTLFTRAFQTRTRARHVFLTSTGLLGLGPPAMQTGDSVLVVPGAYVPYVMRGMRKVNQRALFSEMIEPRKAEERCRREGTVVYRLVGEAYVHGIMRGERTRREGWDPRPIVIE